MYLIFSVIILILLVLLSKGKINTPCMWIVLFNILCIATVYYWIYKEMKESYIVRSNVKDISTFLL